MLTVKDFALRLPSYDKASVSLRSALLSTSCTHKQLAICLVNYSRAGLSLLRKEEMSILFFCVGTWQECSSAGRGGWHISLGCCYVLNRLPKQLSRQCACLFICILGFIAAQNCLSSDRFVCVLERVTSGKL